MPEIKLSIPDWLYNLLPFILTGLIALLLWLSIWSSWASWTTILFFTLLIIIFLVFLIKQKQKRKNLVILLLVILIITGLLYFLKNFEIQKKAEGVPRSDKDVGAGLVPARTKKAATPTPSPSPVYKYTPALAAAKQCVMGASPCKQQLFDWERLTQIIVDEQMILWDPVEKYQFPMIQQPSREVEARLVDKTVWLVYFEVVDKPPTRPGIIMPDQSTKIIIDKTTGQAISYEQGWAPAHATPGQGETIPKSHWP